MLSNFVRSITVARDLITMIMLRPTQLRSEPSPSLRERPSKVKLCVIFWVFWVSISTKRLSWTIRNWFICFSAKLISSRGQKSRPQVWNFLINSVKAGSSTGAWKTNWWSEDFIARKARACWWSSQWVPWRPGWVQGQPWWDVVQVQPVHHSEMRPILCR